MSLYAWGRNNHGQLGFKQDILPSNLDQTRQQQQQQQQQDELQQEQQVEPQQQELQQQLAAEIKFPRSADTRQRQGHKPVRVEVDVDGERFVEVAAGEHHTLIVTQYGDVSTFGRGKEGQLGHGEGVRLDISVPKKVQGLSGATVVAVACGAFHSLAVTSSGRLYEWGLVHTEPDSSSEEEITDAELLALAGPSRNTNNTGSRLASVVADSARRWLAATDAELGDRDMSGDEHGSLDEERELMQRKMMKRLPTRSRQVVPRLATSLREMRVTSVSAGFAHSVAVTDQGRAFSSGQNDRGQLGLSHRIHSGIFREVVGMGDRFIIEVACGEQHNLARVLPTRKAPLRDDRAELYVWGGGRLGQLGLGAASTRLAPTHNRTLSNVGGGVVSISAGANHSVCAVASGWVLSWGHAEYNQQGVAVVAGADLMGDRDGHGYYRIPRVVHGLVGAHVVSVHCGSNFTLAVDRAGVTHSFGWNEGDALGRGWHGAYDPSPVPVPSLPVVASIAAGSRHVAAVTVEGPAVGHHLRSLVGDTDFADVELLAPDAALRGEPGVPVHMSVITTRCPYLAGHVRAALKASAEEEAEHDGTDGLSLPNGEHPKKARLCLENASADTVDLLVKYLYTDEVALDASSDSLGALVGLAQELLLPRLEARCVQRLPYSLRRRYIQRNSGSTLATHGVVDVPRSTFVDDLGRLAGKADLSDVFLVLPTWGWKFHGHKAVLCCSPWWNALLKGGFREGGGETIDMSGLLQEGVTRPEALEATVRHVYTNSGDSVVDVDPSIVMEMVILAEFMVLPSLISACQSELGQYVDEDSASFLADFATRYRLLKLETLCREKLCESTTAVPTATRQ